MMSVCKKALAIEQFIASVNALPNVLTARDYLESEENPDLNFGSQGE